jgi:hypothetical protein
MFLAVVVVDSSHGNGCRGLQLLTLMFGVLRVIALPPQSTHPLLAAVCCCHSRVVLLGELQYATVGLLHLEQ